MKLTPTPRVYFDEISHSYLLDGEVLLMGVTTLMRKHNLSPDYGDIPQSVLDKAAEEGTAIHREIQAYEKGETIFASQLIDDYRQHIASRGWRFVEAEYQVTDWEVVASAIDMVYEKGDGVILNDIKTTQKYHRRSVEWQLGIYRYLFCKLNPDIPVLGCTCTWIDKKSKRIKDIIDVTPVTDAEVQALLQAEKDGLIYIDENDVPAAEEILDAGEAAALAVNAAKIAELEATLKVLKAADEAVRDKLIAYMEKNNLQEISCGGGTFKLKAAYTTSRVDSKKLKEQFPAVYQKVIKDSVTKASLTFKQNQS